MRVKKTAMLIVAAALMVLAAGPAVSRADTGPNKAVGLPVGTGPNGLGTAVGFLPTWPAGRNRFYGIRIQGVAPYVTRVRIRQQFGQGRVIYDGPVQPGQFIAFPDTSIIWNGYRSQNGSHMQGVKVLPRYR